MLRWIRWSALTLIAVLAVFWAAQWVRHDAPGTVQVGGPFVLVNAAGESVTDAQFRGRWMLVYFGYSFCPDVCPTELQAISASLDQLGPLATQVAPVFITIDAERDTPEAIGQYTKLFDDRIVGLTGSTTQIAAVAKAYRVYYAKVNSKDNATYLMDHSSFVYLMAPDGSLRQLFKPGMSGAEMASSIRKQMSPS